MRLLFVKKRLAYPRSSGHDVHTWETMRALTALGHEVAFASLTPVHPQALDGQRLAAVRELSGACESPPPIHLTTLQERYRSYWGIPPDTIAQVAAFSRDVRADAVIVSGLEILPCLAGITGTVRVWYAADEWVRHHLSLVRVGSPATWGNLSAAATKGVYEWSYRSLVDRVWVVSEGERRAVHRVMGRVAVDVVPNGVDVDHWAPTGLDAAPATACFWGRLDFEPNIDAVTWFLREVWPSLRAVQPDATFTVLGYQPIAPLRQLCATTAGVRLLADVPDLRPEIERQSVVVLPFVSGGGIKNKLLEAAALGRAIVASPTACEGLHANAPVMRARRPGEWVEAVQSLWRSDETRCALGRSAREWVASTHSWRSAAQIAANGIAQSLTGLLEYAS